MAPLSFVIDLVDSVLTRHVADKYVEQLAVFNPDGRRPFEHGVDDFFVTRLFVNPLRQCFPVQGTVHDQVDQAVLARIGTGRNRCEE